MKKRTSPKKSSSVSRLDKNVLSICFSYGFTGVNCIISSIINNNADKNYNKIAIVLGVIMFCMVPVSYLDKRKELRSTLSVILCCTLHLAFSICISCIHSSWNIMLLYAVEVIIIISVAYLKK